MIDVINELLHPETLPLSKDGRRAHYEGSIDKKGGNADWDWHLYKRGEEWVLFEQYGPGCILNFVQHRYVKSPEPTFRFYFDDDTAPRFVIKPAEFGVKYPFIDPIAGAYVGLDHNDPIRVVRSFVPMPFTSYCRVTSDIPLEGNSPIGGGWGHVIYHTYSEDVPVAAFDPDNWDYATIAERWRNPGYLPEAQTNRRVTVDKVLKPQESVKLFCDDKAGAVLSLTMQTAGFDRRDLGDLWITMRWDGHDVPDVELPIGCLFGNELGFHSMQYHFGGVDTHGGYRLSIPMPYLQNAEIILQNRGDRTVTLEHAATVTTTDFNVLYAENAFGYFMSTPYYPKKNTHGADSVIAEISGISGHVISSTVTGHPFEGVGCADCEGDARIHFDGLRTPQIESDGSESYSCYGCGFYESPQNNPISGYDGEVICKQKNWSMVRWLPGDFYPFYDALHFAFESFECNNNDMYHSGGVLLYGHRRSRLKPLGEYREEKETLTAFFEGDDDDVPVTLGGTRGEHFTFTVKVEAAKAILLHRVSDQQTPRQYAVVTVDGEELPLPWYFSDSNPCKRWLEDEYVLPSSVVAGKKTVTVTVTPKECGGRIAFNQFGVAVYGVIG